ncbi:MAG: repeat-containing protein [Verrucomicrobiales bacterium]|nr:repeat-containing protein [Verrucomicrobiales bacterium]
MNRSCNQCGNELPEGTAGQRCPVCLLHLALDTAYDEEDAPSPAACAAGQRIGDYHLLKEIARGGMGVVYKAHQAKLNRVVALKLILSGQFASKQEVLRFRAEAEAAASLRHPNIVGIFETGEDDGRHFFSMEYVEGRDLAAIVRDVPLPAARAARYCGIIARAIHYAHQQGTLHRDLKPSNVLLDTSDQLRITDFGLAKRLRGDFGLTVTGQALGSPNFMPPEQTSGKSAALGPATDVYGIGAILYHLLTGRPPFQAATIAEVMRQLHEQEPVPPRLLNPDIPRDLQTITLKCLEKSPGKRYGTAAELAEELERFLRDEPIQARPAGPAEKMWRWCRRKPVIAGLLVSLSIALLLGACGITWQWRHAIQSATALRHGLYTADINLASHVRADKDFNRAANLLRRHIPQRGEDDLRGFEWRYLWELCQGEEAASVLAHDEDVHSVALTPDGRYFLTTGKDRTAKLWSLPNRRLETVLKHLSDKQSLRSVAISANGQRAAVCDGATVTIWDTANWSELKTLEEAAIGVKFLPKSGTLATSTGVGIKIWDEGSWLPRMLVTGPLEFFDFSPDERLLAVARQQTLELHDAKTGELKKVLPGQIQDHAYSLAFSPGGQFVAVGGMYGGVIIWSIPQGEVLTNLIAHDSFVSGLAFSPDGRWLGTGGSDQFVTLWSVAGWHKEAELYGHHNGIFDMAFTPDGLHLVSASRDHTVKFWKIPPAPREHLLGSAETMIGFLPDSRTAVTLDRDATLRFWDEGSGRETLRHHFEATAPATAGAVSRNGQIVALGYWDGTVELHRLPGGELLHRGNGGTNPIFTLEFSCDDKLLASTATSTQGAPSTSGLLMLWEVPSGERLVALTKTLGGWASGVAFSHDNQMLAVSRPDQSILLWDRIRNQPLRIFKGHTWQISSVQFSPDDRTLASASWDTTVRLWDVATGNEKTRLSGLPVGAGSACFSPDGQTLAASFVGNAIQLWHLPNEQELLTLHWSGRFLGQLYFSPDGTVLGGGRFLPFSPDGGVQLWRAPASESAGNSSQSNKSLKAR